LKAAIFVAENFIYIFQGRSQVRKSENRVLKKTFGRKKQFRILGTEDLHDFYTSLSIARGANSRSLGMAEHLAWIGENRHVYRIWCRNLMQNGYIENRKVDGRDNIKMGVRELGFPDGNWMGLA
jgi:alpha-glucosidase (family GH31 glycosyl hydrolase)